MSKQYSLAGNFRRTTRICMISLILLLLLGACASVQEPGASIPTQIIEPTKTKTPGAPPTTQPAPDFNQAAEALSTDISTPTATALPDLRPRPESWQYWPILPDLAPEMMAIYRKGQSLGRDPHVFSVIGDCQSSPTYFLSIYDEGRYSLTQDQVHLQETIDWYAGSFEHRSITVKNGLTAPGALNPRWNDPETCGKTETPVACEIRLNNPSIVLISLGTNWHPSSSPEDYRNYLQQIIDILLENGVIPILSTKADNMEGDHSRNLAMAQAAYDNHLPLWNFWAAVKHLPNMGLDKNRNDEYLRSEGWDVRNLSALEVLDQIHRQLLELDD